MATYQAPPPGATGEDPGRTMGIVGLILAIFCNLIGLVVSIIAYNRSKNAGYKNNIALAGIIVGAVALRHRRDRQLHRAARNVPHPRLSLPARAQFAP